MCSNDETFLFHISASIRDVMELKAAEKEREDE